MSPPKIVHSLPDSMRPLMSFVRYADSLNSVHLRKIFYLMINSYMKLERTILSQINPDKPSATRQIIKKMLPQRVRIKILDIMRALLGTKVSRSLK